jgi:hypothetical protein
MPDDRIFLWPPKYQHNESFQVSKCVPLSWNWEVRACIAWSFWRWPKTDSPGLPFLWTWIMKVLLHWHLRKSIIWLEHVLWFLPVIRCNPAQKGNCQFVWILETQKYVLTLFCCHNCCYHFDILLPILNQLLVVSVLWIQFHVFPAW